MSRKKATSPSPSASNALVPSIPPDARGLQAGVEVATQVADLIRICGECAREIEQHRTERARIDARTRVQVELIRSRRDVLIGVLEQTFAERRHNFDQLFARLDAAAASENSEAMQLVLKTIVDLASHSPFEALRDASRAHQALLDKHTTWEF